jgi:hypothetical protein
MSLLKNLRKRRARHFGTPAWAHVQRLRVGQLDRAKIRTGSDWGEHLISSEKTPENLEGLTEKVGTLGLQVRKRNHCGAAKKRERRARAAEAPAGDSGSGRPRTASGDQPRTQQGIGAPGAQQGKEPAPARRVPTEKGGHLLGPSKRQRSAGGTPEGGQAKRPKQLGQLGYAIVAREGLRVAVVEDYPKSQISRENFLYIQRAIGWLVDELHEEGLTPRLADSYWSKGQPLWLAKMNQPRNGWPPKYPLWWRGRAPGSRWWA